MVKPSDILNARILVVDDEELAAVSLVEILQDSGYTAVTFTTKACEVRDLHSRYGYHLILLDLQMPEKSGFQVMKELSAIGSDDYLPVFALTAEPAYKLQALKAGAKDFISKPFDPEEVLTRIHNMLEVRLLHDEARDKARALEPLALYDALTGLANRRLLTDRISAAIANARRNNAAMAVVYLDLDGFKEVNDTLGHGHGDALLKMVAERLTSAVREEDTAARLGGDEFMIALWHVRDVGDVSTVASKLIELISRPFTLDGHAVSVTVSAGVGIYPTHGVDADTLMSRADAALYAAKRAGKNAFRISQQPEAPAVT
jgi:diguanylate cyclase (GGDEF)-like protein